MMSQISCKLSRTSTINRMTTTIRDHNQSQSSSQSQHRPQPDLNERHSRATLTRIRQKVAPPPICPGEKKKNQKHFVAGKNQKVMKDLVGSRIVDFAHFRWGIDSAPRGGGKVE